MAIPAPFAIPPGQTRSTSSGRCGPCCSTAPHGTMQTLPRSTASLMSGEVSFSYLYSVAARDMAISKESPRTCARGIGLQLSQLTRDFFNQPLQPPRPDHRDRLLIDPVPVARRGREVAWLPVVNQG